MARPGPAIIGGRAALVFRHAQVERVFTNRDPKVRPLRP
jgi:hypothetical protein